MALARGDEPDSATADFFINVADNTPLDHKADDPGNTTGYAVFGQVIVRHGRGGRDPKCRWAITARCRARRRSIADHRDE